MFRLRVILPISIILFVVFIQIASVILSILDPFTETGFLVQDGKPVYITKNSPGGNPKPTVRQVNADPSTFQAIPPLPNAHSAALKYAKDSGKVFVGVLKLPYLLKGSDPSSFTILSQDGKYSKDASQVYYCGIPLKDADPNTFQILLPPYSKDAKNAYAGAVPIEVLDAPTFEVLLAGDSGFPLFPKGRGLVESETVKPRTQIWGWARDNKACYYADHQIIGADSRSFVVLNSLHAKDNNHVYYSTKRKTKTISAADPHTFEVIGPTEVKARDNKQEFSFGEPVK